MTTSPPITQYPVFSKPWGHLSRDRLRESCPGSTHPVQRHNVADRRYHLHLEAGLLLPDIPGLSCTVAGRPGDDSLDVGALPVLLPKLSGVWSPTSSILPFLCRHALLLVVADRYGPRLVARHAPISHRAGRACLVIEHKDPYPPAPVILGPAGLVCDMASRASYTHLSSRFISKSSLQK